MNEDGAICGRCCCLFALLRRPGTGGEVPKHKALCAAPGRRATPSDPTGHTTNKLVNSSSSSSAGEQHPHPPPCATAAAAAAVPLRGGAACCPSASTTPPVVAVVVVVTRLARCWRGAAEAARCCGEGLLRQRVALSEGYAAHPVL